MSGGAAGGSRMGRWLEWTIQRWIRHTGRRLPVDEATWLVGPTGADRIGAGIYAAYAAASGLEILATETQAGLLHDFELLRGPGFSPESVHPDIRRFYEQTSRYSLDTWSEWRGPLKPFARTLIHFVSRDIEQLNLPISPLDTSYGMSSEVILLLDRRTGTSSYAGWLRRSLATGRVIYAGFYTVERPPRSDAPCVKTVFPLPHGSATVFLRPVNQEDGSFKLISDGKGFGDGGYYRIHASVQGVLHARYVPIKESIHVFLDSRQVLRAHHEFRFGPMSFLTLHYKMTLVQTS